MCTINAIVRAGVVELWDSIFDEREREALHVAAEHVSGVRQVKDHVVCGEPYSLGVQ
jgi:osmotically-inducible protein OsmY